MSNGLNVLPSGSHPFHVSTPAEPIVNVSGSAGVAPAGGVAAALPMTSAWGVTSDPTTGTRPVEPVEVVLGAGNDWVVDADSQLTSVKATAATSATWTNQRCAC